MDVPDDKELPFLLRKAETTLTARTRSEFSWSTGMKSSGASKCGIISDGVSKCTAGVAAQFADDPGRVDAENQF